MKLKMLIEKLQDIDAQGHGDCQVFYRVSSSGECGAVNGPRVTNYTDCCGPFDIEPDEFYIELSIGH